MIIDPQRGNYEFVPNELIDFVNNYENTILTKECKIEYKEFIDYLNQNEFCYLSKTKEKYFPKIEIIYKSPSFFENAIIEINNKIEIKKIFSTLEKINNVGCSNFLIYSKEIIDYNLIDKTLEFFSNKYIDNLILYLNYNDIDFIEKLKLLFEKFNFIKQIIIFNSLFDQLININNGYDILVTTRKKLDFYDWNKDVNIMNYSFLHFLEAKNYNTYFNKKISIGYNGIIKNSPNSEVTFGNINNLSEYDLKKLADNNDYNKIAPLVPVKKCIMGEYNEPSAFVKLHGSSSLPLNYNPPSGYAYSIFYNNNNTVLIHLYPF